MNATREIGDAADVAVVLGAAVKMGGKPGRALLRRIDRAVELFESEKTRNLLLTGGTGKYPPSEARLMKDIAVARGVPDNRIVLEKTALSTMENAMRCAGIIGKNGWKKVVLITDAHHGVRAKFLFRVFGVRVELCPPGAPEAMNVSSRRLKSYAKEFAAFAWNLFKLAAWFCGSFLPMPSFDRLIRKP